MSNSSFTDIINKGLEGYLFQVIGSTPASLRDAIKKTDLKAKPDAAASLVMTCLFAAAVNKQVLEAFLAKPEMLQARTVTQQAMVISGRPNMTGLTLFGHALLTTNSVDDIKFAAEFRKKMGQNHIWDGPLSKGSLGEKQRDIMLEKARVHNLEEVRLLGSGFLKYTKLDTRPMSAKEANWWGETYASSTSKLTPQKPASRIPPQPRAQSPARSQVQSRPSSSGQTTVTPPRKLSLTLGETERIAVREDVYKYYMLTHTDEDFVAKIRSIGAEKFDELYGEALSRDPEGKAAGSLAGNR
jgi:hypothetical protein